MAWILLGLAVIANVAANMSFKIAMVAFPSSVDAASLFKFLLTPHLWLGATCCGVLLISYLMALRELELTVSYAFVISLSLIGITALSPWILGDGISLQKVLSIGLVVTGLVLLINDRSGDDPAEVEEASIGQTAKQDGQPR